MNQKINKITEKRRAIAKDITYIVYEICSQVRSCSNSLEWNLITCTAHSTRAKAVAHGQMKSVSLDVIARAPAFWTNRSAKSKGIVMQRSCNVDVTEMCHEKKRTFDVICAHTLSEEWR